MLRGSTGCTRIVSGRPVELSVSHFLPEQYTYRVTLRQIRLSRGVEAARPFAQMPEVFGLRWRQAQGRPGIADVPRSGCRRPVGV